MLINGTSACVFAGAVADALGRIQGQGSDGVPVTVATPGPLDVDINGPPLRVAKPRFPHRTAAGDLDGENSRMGTQLRGGWLQRM